MEKIRKKHEEHIARYSTGQVNKLDSFLCFLYSITIYGINFYFNLLPKQIAIWIVFITFPLILNIIHLQKEKTT